MNTTDKLCIAVIAVTIGILVYNESVIVPMQREKVAAFTRAFVEPYYDKSFEMPNKDHNLTMNEFGNLLIWIACMESKLSCPNNNCLVNAFGGNTTLTTQLCSAVLHDCPSKNCIVLENCIIFDDRTSFFNYIPCYEHSTDNDFSHGNKRL